MATKLLGIPVDQHIVGKIELGIKMITVENRFKKLARRYRDIPINGLFYNLPIFSVQLCNVKLILLS